MVKKRSICFLLSDFLAGKYESPLRIAARRHDVVGVNIIDPREEELPDVGLIRARDAETGEMRWVDTSSRRLRRQYADWHQRHLSYFQATFRKVGADVVNIRTNESYVNALLKFFKQRSK